LIKLFKKNKNKINQEEQSYALSVSAKMSNTSARKRAFIQILGAAKAVDFLMDNKFQPSTATCFHRVPSLLEELQICDILCQNYRLYTISAFKDKTLRIPKIHYDFEISPDYYIVVHISDKLTEARILGYVIPEDVQNEYTDGQYYYANFNSIRPIEELLKVLKRPKIDFVGMVGSHKDCVALFARYIDKELSASYKKAMLQHLMGCESCCARFIDLLEFDNIAKEAVKYPQITKKYAAKVFDGTRIVTLQKGNDGDDSPETFNDEVKIKELNAPKSKAGTRQRPKQFQNSEFQDAVFDINEQNRKISREKSRSIDMMFDKNGQSNYDLEERQDFIKKSKKAGKIIAGILLVCIAAGGFWAYKNYFTQPKYSLIDEVQTSSTDANQGVNVPSDEEILSAIDEALPVEKLDFAIQNAQGPVATTSISSISWEVPESVSGNDDFTRFLQTAGKNVKLNLQNDLLLASDYAMSNQVVVDVKLLAKGGLGDINIIKGSGSDQIDAVILKSVKDALTYLKPPIINVLTPSVVVTLIINL